jgi:hypothetical protein
MTGTEQGLLAAQVGQRLAQVLSFFGTLNVVATDYAVPVDRDGAYNFTKGSAAAITVAAPGAANVGRVLILLGGSDFAHVVTFTGTTLLDGTTGANSTWTTTAFAGCGLMVIAVSATRWQVIAFNLGTIAP